MVRDVSDDREPPAMRHAHDHLADPVRGDIREQGLEHGHERVESLDGERLLSEEGRALVALHGVDLGQALEQTHAVVDGERRPVGARLDVLAQPHPLLVARDVLDLERDGAAVGAPQMWQDLGEVVSGDIDPEQVGGDLLHQLLGEPVGRRVHRGIADRRRPERIEMRAEMTMRPVRLDERRCGLHRREQGAIGGLRGCGGVRCTRGHRARRCRCPHGGQLQSRQVDAKIGSNILVEAVSAVEQRLDAAEELP